MSKAASKISFIRRYDYKRFRLSIGYSGFYALGLAAIVLAVTKLAAGSLGAFPEFLSYGPFGQLFFYNLLVFFVLTIYLIALPGMLIFDGIPTNRWNLYYKNGIGINTLIFNKLLFCVGSLARIYALGLAPILAVGFLTANGSAATILDLVLCALLGVCILLAVVMPALFFGSFLYNRFAVGPLVLLGAAGTGLLLWRAGYFNAADEASAITAVRALMLPAPLSLSVIAIACLLLFSLGAFLFASSKARSYDVEELDDEALIALGVTRDMMVYERDGEDFEVAISGPEVFGIDEELEEPDFTEIRAAYGDEDEEPVPAQKAKKEKKPKKEKKSRRRRDEEEDEANEVDEDEDY